MYHILYIIFFKMFIPAFLKYQSFLITAINSFFLQVSIRSYCAQQGDSNEGAGGGSRRDEEGTVSKVLGFCYHFSLQFD